ncbi:MAG TPA: ABC transporter permease [Polyangiaceae bacterium]|nr:ABC transporter permease [Polyangiaceae bacterium]
MIAAEDEAKTVAPARSARATPATPSRPRAGLFARWESVLVLLLVAVCAANTWASPYFLDAQNLLDSTQSFAEKALIALSMALVIIGRDIDLSIASIVALCGTVIGWLATQGVGTPGLLVASIACGTALGMFNGALVARLGLPAIVVTIGTVSLFRGISFIALGDGAYTSFPEGFDALGQGYLLGVVPYELVVLVVLAAAFHVLLHNTRVGRRLYAYGQNPDAARYSGIDVDAHRFWFFTLNGSMAGLAAALLTSRIGAARPNMASGWDLEVIAIVVLGGVGIGGGTGRMSGVILAVFVMGLLTFGLGLRNVPGIMLNIIVGALLVASVALPAILKRIEQSRRGA